MLPISRQEKIDRIMCKPGYTWNETLGKCLMGGFIREEDGPARPEKPEMPTPDAAVTQEKAARASTPKAVK